MALPFLVHPDQDEDLLKCINAVLDFWFIPSMEVMPDINSYDSIIDAIKCNPDTKVIFYQG